MAAAVPVTLNGNDAVEPALIIVSGLQRIAQLPELQGRACDVHAEDDQLGVRTASAAREVHEWNFDNAETARVRADQHLLLPLEVFRRELHALQRFTSVETKSAG